MVVWINGKFVDRDEARVSAFDAGFQHGVGLFETMAARHGRVFRVMDHLQRLATSASDLRLAEGLRLEPLADAIELTVARNELQEARVRLTVTGGDLSMLSGARSGPADPTIMVVAQSPTRYPAELFSRGVRIKVADIRTNPFDRFAGHKTLWYWPRLSELQAASAAGCAESLFLTTSNHLACGAVSNIFLVRGGELMTPIARGEEKAGALPSPVLPGITRAVVREIAGRMGIACQVRTLAIDDALGADEIFLCNSSWGIMPVVGIEGATVGGGAPGAMTRTLREALSQAIDGETRDAASRLGGAVGS